MLTQDQWLAMGLSARMYPKYRYLCSKGDKVSFVSAWKNYSSIKKPYALYVRIMPSFAEYRVSAPISKKTADFRLIKIGLLLL